MSGYEAGSSEIRYMWVGVAIAVILTTGARAWADEVVPADESAAEIAARAEVSASELAGSVRSFESSLRSAPSVAASDGVLSTEEHTALVEAGMKTQLAALAGELDQLSAALASGADPAGEKVLLESLARRAAALSQLGARSSGSGVPFPPELQSELLALWSDMKALSAKRDAAPALAVDSPIETAP